MTAFKIKQCLYDTDKPVALNARKRDDHYFSTHPSATWRVRPICEGESPIVDRLRESGAMSRAYCIVIDHARARDKRAAAGRGIYPVAIAESDRDRAKVILRREAIRWVKWFQKSSSTPLPTAGNATFG